MVIQLDNLGHACGVFVSLEGEGPVYLQLYRGLREAILGGRLVSGAALPSTRELAEQLELSRNTVLRAYEQLVAEGFASARRGGGTFVADRLFDARAAEPIAQPASIALAVEGQRMIAAMAVNPFAAIAGLAPVPYDFLFGVPDVTLFPIQEWRRTVSQFFDRASKRTLGYEGPLGLTRLRQLIAEHLVKYRGVRCGTEHVAIVSGAQQAIDLIARLLLEPGTHVLVEDPCYPAARAILAAAGAVLVPAPVDAEGIDLERVDPAERDRCRLAYVTPSHQFPSGAVMSARRRGDLLQWAARVGAVIVEDDYDSEYRHVGPPIQALQGLGASDRVVHVGTFSKSLFPSLRLGYLVVPQSLVMPLAAAKWVCDWSSSLPLQHALATFMEAGHFVRHLKRSGVVYAKRRAALLAAIERDLPGAEVWGGDAGMHVVVWLPRIGVSELASAVTRARALGVGVYPVGMFYAEPPQRAGLVLGYSGLSETQIGEGIALLARALRTP